MRAPVPRTVLRRRKRKRSRFSSIHWGRGEAHPLLYGGRMRAPGAFETKGWRRSWRPEASVLAAAVAVVWATALSTATPTWAASGDDCDPADGTAVAAIGRPVDEARRHVPFDFGELQSILRDVYGPEAVLTDRPRAGRPGQVDADDSFTYVRNGRTVRGRLGSARLERARIAANVVAAARLLNDSGASFSATGATDRANRAFWWVGYGGKFGTRMGVKASDAVNDVFQNGHLYGFECATAILLIHYKAILDRIGAEDFDRQCPKLRIFRFDLLPEPLRRVRREGPQRELWPGDRAYFQNPDFAPENSAWQGENAVFLGAGEYFGHGLGIHSREGIVELLNGVRKEGATREAFVDPSVLRLDGVGVSRMDVSPR